MFAEVFGIGMLSFDVVTKVVERFEILVTLAFDAVEPIKKDIVLLRQMFQRLEEGAFCSELGSGWGGGDKSELT